MGSRLQAHALHLTKGYGLCLFGIIALARASSLTFVRPFAYIPVAAIQSSNGTVYLTDTHAKRGDVWSSSHDLVRTCCGLFSYTAESVCAWLHTHLRAL